MYEHEVVLITGPALSSDSAVVSTSRQDIDYILKPANHRERIVSRSTDTNAGTPKFKHDKKIYAVLDIIGRFVLTKVSVRVLTCRGRKKGRTVSAKTQR